jgi:uncharacterized membrane protein YfcA
MAVLFGVMVGLALGLTGGGGSIFAVPLLIYGLGVNARDAIGISLAAVAAMSAFGASGALRARLVEYRAGLVFAAGGIFAASVGVKLSHLFSEGAIVTAFACWFDGAGDIVYVAKGESRSSERGRRSC